MDKCGEHGPLNHHYADSKSGRAGRVAQSIDEQRAVLAKAAKQLGIAAK
jgi:hypothetical protein